MRGSSSFTSKSRSFVATITSLPVSPSKDGSTATGCFPSTDGWLPVTDGCCSTTTAVTSGDGSRVSSGNSSGLSSGLASGIPSPNAASCPVSPPSFAVIPDDSPSVTVASVEVSSAETFAGASLTNQRAKRLLASRSQKTRSTSSRSPVPVLPIAASQILENSAPANPPNPPPKKWSEETRPETYAKMKENKGAAIRSFIAVLRESLYFPVSQRCNPISPVSTGRKKAESPKHPPTRNHEIFSPNLDPRLAGSACTSLQSSML